jgi:hypothetical protein
MSPAICKNLHKIRRCTDYSRTLSIASVARPIGGEATGFRYAGLQNVLIPNIVRAVPLLKTPRIVGLHYVLRKGPQKTVRAFRR